MFNRSWRAVSLCRLSCCTNCYWLKFQLVGWSFALFVCLWPTGHSSRAVFTKLHDGSDEELVNLSRSLGQEVKVRQWRPSKSCELHRWRTTKWIWTKTYTNTYCTWGTTWLHFQCCGSKVKVHVAKFQLASCILCSLLSIVLCSCRHLVLVRPH